MAVLRSTLVLGLRLGLTVGRAMSESDWRCLGILVCVGRGIAREATSMSDVMLFSLDSGFAVLFLLDRWAPIG
jgi:hypothetical protein